MCVDSIKNYKEIKRRVFLSENLTNYKNFMMLTFGESQFA